jgi:hypothetical protein
VIRAGRHGSLGQYRGSHVEEDQQEEDPQPAQEGQPRQAPEHRTEVALPHELDGLTINASPDRWRELGFRIATLRKEAGAGVAVAFMSR